MENMIDPVSKRSKKEEEAEESRLGLIVFDTTNIAMRVESLLQEAEISCRIIPTPLEISSECGISILIDSVWIEKADSAILGACIEGYRMIFPFVRGKS